MEKIHDVYIWEHNLAGLSILILGVLGIIINVGLLFVLGSTGRHTNQNPNYLLINLALSNLAICIFAYPISGYAGLKHSWVWGDGVCIYYGTIALILGFSIMITMLMLILDIYLDSHSANYESEKDKLRGYMILFIWLNSLFWGLAPLVGWSKIWYEPSEVSCTVDIMNPDIKYISYIILCGIWCYLLPVVAMVYCKLKLKSNGERPTSSEVLYSHKEQIIGLILLFVLEWTPYLVVYAWPLFDKPEHIPIRLDLAAPIIAKTCVVLNPLLFLVYSVEPKNDTAAKATRYSEVNVAQPE